ncbi:carboxylating nicotinate-nucleotide diphosphorylase [Desulfosudis oleivorans]|uniref:Probable nicotinate-nucleotide pyrophosphorylase [carboxylating] n=1 Tax=Desulfosudis oleivorans (strain DSM 6200 / JCM 39069 / Hxd3) TaxID=96561 RepID=A9A0N2_DESOH|nr:carboxylating nicotinate-nucleotide diphosphorylase [Desulfosudis oleivorans]ABW67532.1 nicotinate-nucleotide pyrophosphorylase [Desulfosudis oleivorans Hxd3]
MELLIPYIIESGLSEDIGAGDITTDALIDAEAMGRGYIVAKEDLVIAGLNAAAAVFETLDPEMACLFMATDGDRVKTGTKVMQMEGSMQALLKGERLALNILQRLSGIATFTRACVDELAGTTVRLVDTRKTTPGLRVLEKYAVRAGGAANHRMGLFDGVLIKDNHIAACGGIAQAVAKARAAVHHLVKIEIEVSNQDEVAQALEAGADVIMLDNMDMEAIRQAVNTISGRALVEVSGSVARENLRALADTGVNIISMGSLTHSARAVDLSMRIAAEK